MKLRLVALVAIAGLLAGTAFRNAPTNSAFRMDHVSVAAGTGGGGGSPDPALGVNSLEFAPTDGGGMGTECACADVTASTGEALTTTRPGVTGCLYNNSQLYKECPADKPVVAKEDGFGSQLGLWVVPSYTNLILSSREILPDSWTKQESLSVERSFGMNADGGGGTKLTNTGQNQIWQDVTGTSGTYIGSFYMKLVTGGTCGFYASIDGATTITDDLNPLLSTTKWKRVLPVLLPSCYSSDGGTDNCIVQSVMQKSGLTNPQFHYIINGYNCAVAVDLVSLTKTSTVDPIPIVTTTVAATRNAPVETFSTPGSNWDGGAGWDGGFNFGDAGCVRVSLRPMLSGASLSTTMNTIVQTGSNSATDTVLYHDGTNVYTTDGTKDAGTAVTQTVASKFKVGAIWRPSSAPTKKYVVAYTAPVGQTESALDGGMRQAYVQLGGGTSTASGNVFTSFAISADPSVCLYSDGGTP